MLEKGRDLSAQTGCEREWLEPYKGYQYQDRHMTVEAAEQQRLLELCGIDPEIYGAHIDPAGFISLAIQEGVRNRIHANGTVNMVQSLAQHRPMRLGEPLTAGGRITEVEEVPRGRVATSETWFAGADGRRALTSGRKSLRPDPARVGTRGAGEKDQPVIADAGRLRELARYTLVAEKVAAYSGPHNPIHFDPAAAKRGGFRAPIIGGGQGVRFLTAEIWRRYRPREIALEIYFRRPIFWDESVAVAVEETGDRWTAIALLKDGKVATEARIDRIA
jgi:acyl dehydratase